MGKHDHMKILKKTKGRVQHFCQKCGIEIPIGEFYYREFINDKFLHQLQNRKFCSSCFEKYGERLLSN
jgi:hypothetical protein